MTIKIILPNNHWQPRHYQKPLWKFLENGGKRACITWHRRSGKDECCLHFLATKAIQETGTYWYMLPQAAQARKAIWTAINPHSGLRRLEEIFPKEIISRSRDQEMYLQLINGSTIQIVGSDNFNSLVGSPPIGVIFSEYSLSNPASWAYIRPILIENNGWAIFNFTPRGKNHAYELLKSVKNDNQWFSEVLTVDHTGVFSESLLLKEKQEYINQFGEAGIGLFNQEYYCQFDAAFIGAVYSAELQNMKDEGRITNIDYNNNELVSTAWDLGRADHTVIIFYQVIKRKVYIIDYIEDNFKDLDYYCNMVLTKPYIYHKHYLPHDALSQNVGMQRTIAFQIANQLGKDKIAIIERQNLADGLAATRVMLSQAVVNELKCYEMLEHLRAYRYAFDETHQCFKDKPLHDAHSHCADAVRYLALAWRQTPKIDKDSFSKEDKLAIKIRNKYMDH